MNMKYGKKKRLEMREKKHVRKREVMKMQAVRLHGCVEHQLEVKRGTRFPPAEKAAAPGPTQSRSWEPGVGSQSPQTNTSIENMHMCTCTGVHG